MILVALVLPALSQQPVLVAHRVGVGDLLEVAVYDDGLVLAPNHSFDENNQSDYLAGRLGPHEVRVLLLLIDILLAQPPGPETMYGLTNCTSVPIIERYEGERVLRKCDGLGPACMERTEGFAVAWHVLRELQKRATQPYLSQVLRWNARPFDDRWVRRARHWPELPLTWAECGGRLCAVTERSQYDALFSRSCGYLRPVTAHRACERIRIGDAPFLLQVEDVLPGEERWSGARPVGSVR